MVNYGTVLLTDLLFGGNLLHAISKVRYKSFHVRQKVFRMFVYSAERDHNIRKVVAYCMCTVNFCLADTSL